jgi:hypothetical protein
MTPATRALATGIVAAAVAWLAGFVFFPLRSLVAVAVVFLLATVVAALGEAGYPAAAPRHPYVSAAAAAIIATLLVIGVLFVITPTYIGSRMSAQLPALSENSAPLWTHCGLASARLSWHGKAWLVAEPVTQVRIHRPVGAIPTTMERSG